MEDNKIHKLLETAQATYGYANQIAVAVEELCELGAVLSKYPRYDYHDDAMEAIRDKVVEETADVLIMMRHVQMIFGIQPTEMEEMMDKKLNRLKRWLENEDKSFHHTTEDREVEPTVEYRLRGTVRCKEHPEGCSPECYGWEHIGYCQERCEVTIDEP